MLQITKSAGNFRAMTTVEGGDGKKRKSDKNANYISEWYGRRIYPKVNLNSKDATSKNFSTCPFLSNALGTQASCVKGENSAGVCTISSVSNGTRQDWLVCPYRVIDSGLVGHACRLLFGVQRAVFPKPVSVLGQAAEAAALKDEIARFGSAYVFFQDKLGGEISVSSTQSSPEISFDVTLVEITARGDDFEVSRYGILEIQTMDYHGSYKRAVGDLRDAHRLHRSQFPSSLEKNLQWAANGIEGPNIANVFKRTFYQMMLKFKLAGQGAVAGTMLALPAAVWDSWQPFLGAPRADDDESGLHSVSIEEALKLPDTEKAFICLFDLDSSSSCSISPVSIDKTLRVSPERLVEHAFHEVPSNIVSNLETTDLVISRIKTRLKKWWPGIGLV